MTWLLIKMLTHIHLTLKCKRVECLGATIKPVLVLVRHQCLTSEMTFCGVCVPCCLNSLDPVPQCMNWPETSTWRCPCLSVLWPWNSPMSASTTRCVWVTIYSLCNPFHTLWESGFPWILQGPLLHFIFQLLEYEVNFIYQFSCFSMLKA